ncbi:hypothetical protein ASJ81_15085 [Methanosarcina spelaei]|uniref:Glycosyltransferase RgtA/B/C/D-like domain-containing protein n=1 Tax=Methanosarcina spelaei TaxID=1036679 RepID=A0A2A2HXF4_9EURY|nr:hypothetical protein [Methanosarcina spelaei]PAV14117.1 hypothetical protein ASJ81_15085 [Methanosarcina spelaei]
MDNIEKRSLKLWGIAFCCTVCYFVIHCVFNEVDFQRYSNIFSGFIEMYRNGYISLDYLKIVPLVDSNISINHSFSPRIQGIMYTESYFVLFIYLFIVTQLITNISTQLLVVLPLGILFIPFIWLALIRTSVPLNDKFNNVFRFLLSLYALLFLMTTGAYGSFYVAPAAALLFLISLLCVFKYYYLQDQRAAYFSILVISQLCLALYWHTLLMTSLFFIISLFTVSSLLYLYSLTTKNQNQIQQYNKFYKLSKSTSITIIVISITFIHLWQSSYLYRFTAEANIWDFLSKAIIKLQGGVPFVMPYSFSYKNLFFGHIYFQCYLLIYVFATISLLVPIILNIYYIKTGKSEIKVSFLFAISIIIAQIVHVVSYYKTQAINFIYIPSYFPLFGIHLFANTIKSKDRFYHVAKFTLAFSFIMLVILSSICVFSLYNTKEGGTTSVLKYVNTKTSFNWVYNNIDHENKKVIVDFNILGKYVQREAYTSKLKINYIDLSSSHYGCFLGDSNNLRSSLSKNYFLLDHASMAKGLPVHTYYNRGLLCSYLDKVDNCSNQQKIYDDSYISVYQIC